MGTRLGGRLNRPISRKLHSVVLSTVVHYCLAAGDQSHYGPVVTVNNARQFPLPSGLIELQMTHEWFVV